MNTPVSPQWLMCPPDHYGIEYVINSWMEGNIGIARQKIAYQQWEKLYQILSARSTVHLLPAIPGLPDLCFTANAGLVLEQTFIPTRFRFLERQHEEPYFLKWFCDHGFSIAELTPDIYFEGEGDALFQPGEALLWMGYNMRSSIKAQQPLQQILNMQVIPLCLVNPHFYHLDTCFAPLPNGRVLYYPPAFDSVSLQKIQARIPQSQRLEVSDEDAMNFACNGIVCGNTFICNLATPALRNQLTAWGFEVITTPLTEFLLAGGAAKCLTLCLTQNITVCSKSA